MNVPLSASRGRLHLSRPQTVPGLDGTRRLTLYLPPGYDHGQQKYPVAYMFDGQNLFEDAGSFSGGWHLHRVLDALHARGHRVPIVVGIHHGGEFRIQEYAPWPVRDGHEALGDVLLDWVTGRLEELVQEDLRVLVGREHRMIGGSSMGGLMALYGLFRHEQFFSKALCMSPSLWVKEGEVFHHVSRAPVTGSPRIYLDCGGREANGIVIQHARWMADLLGRKGFVSGEHLMWRPHARGGHDEKSWRRRLPTALRYLYPSPPRLVQRASG